MASSGDHEACTCENDPNFAVICSFLEKFASQWGLGNYDFAELQAMLEDTQEVSQVLIDMHLKLLRKAKKTVTAERWERHVILFCHTFSSQDAWELERFGYKKARLSSKLRLLKELLECQFDRYAPLKNIVNKMTAEELRSQPLGRDKFGNSYWYQNDDGGQIRIYKEDLEEETWKLVVRDREGLVALISELTNGDSKLSSDSPANEDSNSLSEKPIIDTGQPASNSSDSKNLGDSEDSSEKKDSEEGASDNANLAADVQLKPEETTKNKKKRGKRSRAESPEENLGIKKLKLRSLRTGGFVSEAIEEPVMRIEGSGSGEDNKANPIIGEEIQEDVFYVVGLGSGADCTTGNQSNEEKQASNSIKTISETKKSDNNNQNNIPPSPKKVFKLGTIIDAKKTDLSPSSSKSPLKKSRWDMENKPASGAVKNLVDKFEENAKTEPATPPPKPMFFFGRSSFPFTSPPMTAGFKKTEESSRNGPATTKEVALNVTELPKTDVVTKKICDGLVDIFTMRKPVEEPVCVKKTEYVCGPKKSTSQACEKKDATEEKKNQDLTHVKEDSTKFDQQKEISTKIFKETKTESLSEKKDSKENKIVKEVLTNLDTTVPEKKESKEQPKPEHKILESKKSKEAAAIELITVKKPEEKIVEETKKVLKSPQNIEPLPDKTKEEVVPKATETNIETTKDLNVSEKNKTVLSVQKEPEERPKPAEELLKDVPKENTVLLEETKAKDPKTVDEKIEEASLPSKPEEPLKAKEEKLSLVKETNIVDVVEVQTEKQETCKVKVTKETKTTENVKEPSTVKNPNKDSVKTNTTLLEKKKLEPSNLMETSKELLKEKKKLEEGSFKSKELKTSIKLTTEKDLNLQQKSEINLVSSSSLKDLTKPLEVSTDTSNDISKKRPSPRMLYSEERETIFLDKDLSKSDEKETSKDLPKTENKVAEIPQIVTKIDTKQDNISTAVNKPSEQSKTKPVLEKTQEINTNLPTAAIKEVKKAQELIIPKPQDLKCAKRKEEIPLPKEVVKEPITKEKTTMQVPEELPRPKETKLEDTSQQESENITLSLKNVPKEIFTELPSKDISSDIPSKSTKKIDSVCEKLEKSKEPAVPKEAKSSLNTDKPIEIIKEKPSDLSEKTKVPVKPKEPTILISSSPDISAVEKEIPSTCKDLTEQTVVLVENNSSVPITLSSKVTSKKEAGSTEPESEIPSKLSNKIEILEEKQEKHVKPVEEKEVEGNKTVTESPKATPLAEQEILVKKVVEKPSKDKLTSSDIEVLVETDKKEPLKEKNRATTPVVREILVEKVVEEPSKEVEVKKAEEPSKDKVKSFEKFAEPLKPVKDKKCKDETPVKPVEVIEIEDSPKDASPIKPIEVIEIEESPQIIRPVKTVEVIEIVDSPQCTPVKKLREQFITLKKLNELNVEVVKTKTAKTTEDEDKKSKEPVKAIKPLEPIKEVEVKQSIEKPTEPPKENEVIDTKVTEKPLESLIDKELEANKPTKENEVTAKKVTDKPFESLEPAKEKEVTEKPEEPPKEKELEAKQSTEKPLDLAKEKEMEAKKPVEPAKEKVLEKPPIKVTKDLNLNESQVVSENLSSDSEGECILGIDPPTEDFFPKPKEPPKISIKCISSLMDTSSPPQEPVIDLTEDLTPEKKSSEAEPKRKRNLKDPKPASPSEVPSKKLTVTEDDSASKSKQVVVTLVEVVPSTEEPKETTNLDAILSKNKAKRAAAAEAAQSIDLTEKSDEGSEKEASEEPAVQTKEDSEKITVEAEIQPFMRSDDDDDDDCVAIYSPKSVVSLQSSEEEAPTAPPTEEKTDNAIQIIESEPELVEETTPQAFNKQTFSMDFTESSAPFTFPPMLTRALRKRGIVEPLFNQLNSGKKPKLKGKRAVDVGLRKSVEEKKESADKSSSEEDNGVVTISDGDTPSETSSKPKYIPKGRKKRKGIQIPNKSPKEPKIMTEEELEKQKKNRNKRILSNLGISGNFNLDEMPSYGVRQSRRLAQLKIREQSEVKRVEEVEEVEKKKAVKTKTKPTVEEKKLQKAPLVVEISSSPEPKEAKKTGKKKRKKLVNPKKLFDEKKPWKSSSGSDTSEEEEEVEYEEEEELHLELRSDHEFSPESDLGEDGEQMPLRRARTARKEESDVEEDDDCPCQKCGKSDHPKWILLCDKCDKGWHCSCLRPTLFVIPEGDWYCPPCQHEKLITSLQAKLKHYDATINKKIAEKRRKERLAYVGISLNNVLKTCSETEAPKRKPPGERTSKRRNRDEEDESSTDESEGSSGSDSESQSDSDEPIYQLRERRQAQSYKFNEYDDMIKSAIGEIDPVKVAGNQGRGKDIATIVNAEKEETEENLENKTTTEPSTETPLETPAEEEPAKEESESEDEAIAKPKFLGKKKHRRLNSLEVDSEDDADSDEDFKQSSESEEDEFDEDLGSDSDDYVRGKRKNAPRRSARARTSRYDADFINDDSDSEEKTKKRKKRDWSESESEESDASWGRRKRRSNKTQAVRTPSSKKKKSKKKKKNSLEDSDFETYKKKKPKIKYGGLESSDEDLGRRTRGKKTTYIDTLGSDSEEEQVKRHSRKIESDEDDDEYVAEDDDKDSEEEVEEPPALAAPPKANIIQSTIIPPALEPSVVPPLEVIPPNVPVEPLGPLPPAAVITPLEPIPNYEEPNNHLVSKIIEPMEEPQTTDTTTLPEENPSSKKPAHKIPLNEPLISNSIIENEEDNDELSEPPGVSLLLFSDIQNQAPPAPPVSLTEETTPKKRRGRGKGKKSLEEAVASLGSKDPKAETSNIEIAAPPQPFSQSQPTPSVITRMLQSKPLVLGPGYPVGSIRPKQFAAMADSDPEDSRSRSPGRLPQGPQFLAGGHRGLPPSPYRPLPPGALNHYAPRAPLLTPQLIRPGGPPTPPNLPPHHVFHPHRPIEASPSGGPINMVTEAPASSPKSESNSTPPPPPQAYVRPPGRFAAPGGHSPRQPFHMMMSHLGHRPPNLAPPFPPYYGGFPASAASEDAMPPYETPYPPEQFSGDVAAENSNSKSYDEESGGEFGGLVSYFSSQREDDLES